MLGFGADVRQAQLREGHNGEAHDFYPDFIVRLATDPIVHLILETKGYDPLVEDKEKAAPRWVKAVNAERRFGRLWISHGAQSQ